MPDNTQQGSNEQGGGESGLGSVIGSMAKSFGSGLGRYAMDVLTRGGYGAVQQRKEEETQATLIESMKQRAANGEAMTSDDYNAARAANMDPTVVGAIDKEALSYHKQKVESLNQIDTLEKAGGIDAKTATLYRLAIHSNDPTIKALVVSSMNANAKMLAAQYGLLGRELTAQATIKGHEISAGATKYSANARLQGEEARAGATLGAARLGAATREDVETRRENAASNLETQREGGRQRLEALKAHLNAGLKDTGLDKAAKTIDGALKVINTAAPGGTPLDDPTRVATARAANLSAMERPGFDISTALANGAFVLPGGGPGVKGLLSVGNAAGLTGAAGVQFNAAVSTAMKALRGGNLAETQRALQTALASLPDDARATMTQQIAAMLNDFAIAQGGMVTGAPTESNTNEEDDGGSDDSDSGDSD